MWTTQVMDTLRQSRHIIVSETFEIVSQLTRPTNSSKPKASSWHLFFLCAKLVICLSYRLALLPFIPLVCHYTKPVFLCLSWWTLFCGLSNSSASCRPLPAEPVSVWIVVNTSLLNRKWLTNTGYWQILWVSRKDVSCYAQMASQNRNLGSMLSRYVSQGSTEKQNQWDICRKIWSDLLWRICSANYGC